MKITDAHLSLGFLLSSYYLFHSGSAGAPEFDGYDEANGICPLAETCKYSDSADGISSSLTYSANNPLYGQNLRVLVLEVSLCSIIIETVISIKGG